MYNSSMIRSCSKTLGKLGERNIISLIWVPGHTSQKRIEQVDALARQDTKETFIEPGPVRPLSKLCMEL